MYEHPSSRIYLGPMSNLELRFCGFYMLVIGFSHFVRVCVRVLWGVSVSLGYFDSLSNGVIPGALLSLAVVFDR